MKTYIPKIIALAVAAMAGSAIGADFSAHSSKPWLTPEPRETFTIAVVADADIEYLAAEPIISSKPWVPQGQPDSRVYVAVGGPGSFGGTEQSSKPWLVPMRSLTELDALKPGDRLAFICTECGTTTYRTLDRETLPQLKQGRDKVIYECEGCHAEGCCYVVKQP